MTGYKIVGGVDRVESEWEVYQPEQDKEVGLG
jgi:hypothetical protein